MTRSIQQAAEKALSQSPGISVQQQEALLEVLLPSYREELQQLPLSLAVAPGPVGPAQPGSPCPTPTPSQCGQRHILCRVFVDEQHGRQGLYVLGSTGSTKFQGREQRHGV